VIPDGSYNVRFKIYDGGTSGGPAGQGAANAGTLLWTETWQNSASNGIVTKNGYITATLGSITAFSGINWDQELWITMDVGGTSVGASPTYDGEMLQTGNKRIRITAVPYAQAAGKLQTTSGANTSTLSITAPTVGNQTFVLQDQAASGTFNICIQNSASCGFLKKNAQDTSTLGTLTAGQYLYGFSNTSATASGVLSLTNGASSTGNTLYVTSSGNPAAGNALIVANAATGVTGNLLDLQLNAVSKFSVNQAGNVTTAGTINGLTLTSAADGFTIAGGTTSRTLTVTGANITVGSTITPTAAGALTVRSNGANSITVDTGGGATLNLGNTNATNVTVGNAATAVLNIGNIAPTSARTTTIAGGNSGVVDTVNIGTGNPTVAGGKTVNIGTGTPTGAGSNLVTIGSTALASATTINAGTGGLLLDTGTTGAISLGTGTSGSKTIQIGTTSVNTGNTQAIGIGNTAVAGTTNITIGATTGATGGTTTVQSLGTLALGNTISPTVALQSSAAGAINIGTASTTGTVTIGGTSTSGIITLGQSSGVNNTINIGSNIANTFTQTINIGTSATGTTNTTIGSATAGTLILQGATRISALTTNGFVKTTGGNGALSVSSAVVLTTDVSGILPAANGGTGNGFTAFTGPTTATKTFTLPDVSTTICTTNSVCTGYAPSATNGYIQLAPASIQADSTTNTSIFLNKTGASGNIADLRNNNTSVFTLGNTGVLTVQPVQPAISAGNGTTQGTTISLNGGTGGNTSGTTGQTAGQGGNLVISGGTGGTAGAGSTNGRGGDVTIQGGLAGAGAGTGNFNGNILLQPGTSNVVGIGTATPTNQLTINTLTTSDGTYTLALTPRSTTNKGILVQGLANQSGDLFQAQTSTGGTLFQITATGQLTVNPATPAAVSGNGTSQGTGVTLNGGAGGNTTGTTGQTAGTGGNLSIIAGNGGTAGVGSTNGTGGSITIQPGAPGAGAGTAGQGGQVIVQPAGVSSNRADFFQIRNGSGLQVASFDTTAGNNALNLGAGTLVNGKLNLYNSTNGQVVSLTATATTTGYALNLPATVGAANDCLKNSGVAGTLTFGACGSGSTLQGAYNAGSAGDQVIALSTANDSIIIRNPAASGTDSTYVLTLDQLATGAKGGLSIQSAGTGNLLLVRCK
jgi:hypothetical protein